MKYLVVVGMLVCLLGCDIQIGNMSAERPMDDEKLMAVLKSHEEAMKNINDRLVKIERTQTEGVVK